MSAQREIWTIGHWTCPVPDFLTPLEGQCIEVLADVRAHPGSRRNPQFGKDAMAQWLPEGGVEYRWMPALAGRRPRQDVDPNINAGWHNASFKNYADYTLSAEFREGIDDLSEIARDRRTVIMCGEPMPWRCHRLLISNTLTAHGWTVHHLITGGSARTHLLGQWGATPSVDEEHHVTYPDQPGH